MGTGTFDPGTGNFPNGCQIAEVEVDPDTGKVSLANMTIVGDVGNVINPLLLEGQIHGGITQGVGQALFENIVYENESGQLLSASFQDYTMPRADDVPLFNASSHPVPTGTPLQICGNRPRQYDISDPHKPKLTGLSLDGWIVRKGSRS